MRALALWVALMVLGGAAVAAEVSAPAESVCMSVPCGVGAGPVGKLGCLSGREFDAEYMRQMYQQHSDVEALAVWGASRLTDSHLRDFASKIYSERGDMRSTLSVLYAPCDCGKLCATTNRVYTIETRLATICGMTTNNAWVITMLALMEQSKQAGILARSRLTTQALRDQANNVVEVSDNEMSALRRWQRTTFLTHEQEERFCGMHPTDPRCP